MKSEHRHELKTNELAEWMVNFPQWTKKNAKTIIYVCVLIIVVTTLYFYKRYQKNVVSVKEFENHTNLIAAIPSAKINILRSQSQGIDISYSLLDQAKKMGLSIQNATSDEIAALALIKQGQLLRTELHYRLEKVSKENLAEQVNQAKNCYLQAILKLFKDDAADSTSQKTSSNPSLLAKAQFGLGLCEEDLGNFEKAKEIYQEISTKPEFENTTAAVSAKYRLKLMADYQNNIVFQQAPKPVVPIQTNVEVKPLETTQDSNTATKAPAEVNSPSK